MTVNNDNEMIYVRLSPGFLTPRIIYLTPR